MSSYVFKFQDIDKDKKGIAGGKGANLGELFKLKEVNVPEGFCISVNVFKGILDKEPNLRSLIKELDSLTIEEKDKIKELSKTIRQTIELISIPKEILREINDGLDELGEKNSYAIRSSATAEDMPNASFAGQQDSYLNIIGKDNILKYISKCFASLFNERAVIYRIQKGFSQKDIDIAVIVQKMILGESSGILFTADPINFNRKIVSIDASFGIGEALVSGLVNPDVYKVRENNIIDKKIGNKKIVIYGTENGGTRKSNLDECEKNKQVLTNENILKLEKIGRVIERYFGCPQDIEWCLKDEVFYIVQARPITTLYPIPKVKDIEKHVYISVGHQQMMTDAMKPLGISLFQLTAVRGMFNGGGRLFVDIFAGLNSSKMRPILINNLGKSDPLLKDALINLVNRKGFMDVEGYVEVISDNKKATDFEPAIENNPQIILDLIKKNKESIEKLEQDIKLKSGTELFEFILEDIKELKESLTNPISSKVIMAGMNGSVWLNETIETWLGEKNVVDILSQSVENNITSKMGLDLMDIADLIRPYPEIIKYLEKVDKGNFIEGLDKFKGGERIKEALYKYLSIYGMRGVGEIDITKPRFSEKPSMIIPMLLNNVKNFKQNAGKEKFEEGLKKALIKEKEILEKLSLLEDGEEKARKVKEVISLIRNFIGYREYPKYGIVSRYFIYKKALLKEAERLVEEGIIKNKEDIFYLTFEELQYLIKTKKLEYRIITKAQEEYRLYQKLTPPRIMTSEGEIIKGYYKKKTISDKELLGLPVSSGVVEGTARVILNIEDADLKEGDILVTPFTDPSWTPVFVSLKGLITEVGGLMTHGAVIAREYGLPAIVGVENATKIIKDGQKIRLSGTEGYIEILE